MSSPTSSSPPSTVVDSKALKPVDMNRQLSTQNVGELHERICREMPVPPTLVEKIIAFHFGQLTLTVEHLTQYYLFLETRFRRFVKSLKAFESLTAEDREYLLTSNAPFYFQLYLARYINAYDGLSQVKALLGRDIPSDLKDCDKFLTISFRYFASALVLFSDRTSMELYEDRANLLKHVTLLNDDRKIGHLVSCFVFFREPGCSHGTYDNPIEIGRAFEWSLRTAATHFEPKTYWASLSNLNTTVTRLKYMVNFYSSQANIREPTSSYMSLDGTISSDSLFNDLLLDNEDAIALTTLPHPETAREEDTIWLCRQLTACDSRTRHEINLGVEYLNEAAMLLLLHEDAPLSDKFFMQALKTFSRRAHLLLTAHHEFTDIMTAAAGNDANLSAFKHSLEANVTSAAAFVFAVTFDEMSTSNVFGGLCRMMGDDDQKYWHDNYAMLSPNETTEHLVSVDRQLNLSFLGLPPDMLSTYMTLASRLRESLGELPVDLVTLIQLVILWRVPESSPPSMASRDCHPAMVQAGGLSERYLFHLSERLDKCGLSQSLMHQLFCYLPFQSFVVPQTTC